MHSSTSNSSIDSNKPPHADEVVYRIIPQARWLRAMLIAISLLIPGIAAWEFFARSMGHQSGNYQSAFTFMWAEERKKLDQPNISARVLLMGSSRLLWASDLDILEQQMGTRPIQLSLPGTSPSVFVEDIVENTAFDGLIVVGVTPFLFNRLDKGAFGEGAWSSYTNQSPSKLLGSYLHDKLSMNFGFIDESFDLFALINRYSRMPPREGSLNLNGEQWKLGDFFPDRQADMWPPVEQVGSFDNQQVTNFWLKFISGEPPPKPVIEKMTDQAIAFYQPLIKQLRARGGDMIFIRLPSAGRYGDFEQQSNYKNWGWQVMVEQLNVASINTMDFPELSSELTIPEWSHLSRESQDIWSRKITPYINRALIKQRGVSLEQLLYFNNVTD